MKRIGVLCSGGDAPGMNAAIRAVVRRGLGLGLEVFGVRDGYTGLLEDDVSLLSARDVGNIVQRGGTVLGTSRCPEFMTERGRARAAAMLERHGIEGLVVIGGDGSFRGGAAIAREHGVKVIGLPGTIDNDIAGTDATIGFDTAVNTALESIDRLRDTAESHERLFFVEVMGRSSGFIAAHVAVAGGAEAVLVPEEQSDLGELAGRIQRGLAEGKRSAIVIISEGDEAGGALETAKRVGDHIGYDSRVCILGHVQRGGAPTAQDRILASRLGAAAVERLANDESGVALGVQAGAVVATPLAETFESHKAMGLELIELAEALAG